MVKDFDFDAALKGFIELVEINLKKSADATEHQFEWLSGFPAKAKQKLNSAPDEFKMPKTPARKKTRQQKKRLLNEDDDNKNDNHSSNDMPVKKGKLSHEDDDLSESIVGRSKRQASCAAKSKIQQSLKLTLKQKLRRPSTSHEGCDSNMSTSHEVDDRNNHPAMECGSPVNTRTVGKKEDANRTITIVSETMPLPTKATLPTSGSSNPPVNSVKVNFALESTYTSARDMSCEFLDARDGPSPQPDEIVSVSEPAILDEPPKAKSKQNDPVKKTRPTRKAKKQSDIMVEDEKIDEDRPVEDKSSTKESTPPSVETVAKRPSSEIAGEVAKKKTRRVKKTTEERPPSAASVSAASPRVTRHQKTQPTSSSVVPVAPNSPRLDKFTSKRNLIEQATRTTPNSSPVRKVFTPKLVFSPFKASSVKTKVEAFEAALGTPGVKPASTKTTSVLPEARVLLKRLTDEELKKACASKKKLSESIKETNVKNCTFVLDEENSETEKKSERKSVAQILARKSVDKAKFVALSAARNKALNNITNTETCESPSVHVNRNAANIMSKYRFATASGSSGSSSSSLNRFVSLTQGKTSTSSVSGTFTGTKPLASVPIKAAEEEDKRRKEMEIKRLREREEEAARKREELIKAKAEEQKRKHEARAKRAMEQRLLRAKQLGEEQKQKMENKEEKCAIQKQKLLAEYQEKAERARAVMLQRQHEAELRRKAEELQKQEEEQLRLLAAKKEQEEHEKLAKLRQAEAEKAKPAVPVPVAVPLNTTVTLPPSIASNYQITPVRVTKAGKIFNPDNYDLADMRSDDSTDDESRPKKVIPTWARSVNLKVALGSQAQRAIDTEEIFPPVVLQRDPNLNEIFKIKRARFDKRTSSAVWKTPPAHYL